MRGIERVGEGERRGKGVEGGREWGRERGEGRGYIEGGREWGRRKEGSRESLVSIHHLFNSPEGNVCC